MKTRLNVGLIGYQFMGRAHSNAYRQVGRFFDLPIEIGMRTLCGRTRPAVEEAARNLGWAQVETDWRRVVDDPEIDIVDVSTSGSTHAEIAIAAAEAGKIVFCEKPIGNTLDEARRMLEAVERAGVAHAVFHNYRKAPAVSLARRLISEGRLGRIYHFRGVYLQDWIADPSFPLVWRLRAEEAGSGALGDIGAHSVDLARYLVGELADVCGMTTTFIAERPIPGGGRGRVTVDDAALFLAHFQNGAVGSFEATRFAVGRKNANRFEINGERGSLAFDLERMNELEFFDATETGDAQGFRRILATEPTHPYAGRYWPPGHIIGYEHTFINLVADALIAIAQGETPSPSLGDGYENQRVLDAVMRSQRDRGWVTLQ